MKKITYILIFLPLFMGMNIDKEIPSKLYYLNKEYVEYIDYLIDGDTYIGLWDEGEIFNFKTPQKVYEIYFDKKFTSLAVRMKVTKENEDIHYERFDIHGTLRMEYFKKNNKDYGQFKSWYSNSNLKNITYYNELGKPIADSAFYSDKKLSKVIFHSNDNEYKECNFYKNGERQEEIYFSNPGQNAVFIIKYDSISNAPSMFYINDTTMEDTNNPGTFISQWRLIPTDSAQKIKLKK